MPGYPEFAKCLSTPEPPELGPGPRAGVRSEADLNRELDRLLARAEVGTERAQLIRALVLLWHDHLDAGHTLAQSVDGANGAFVHGIMHRREPDFGNATYWFRRVGRHGAFAALARRVGTLLDPASESELQRRLIRSGAWDPFAFIEECEHVATDAGSTRRKELLRQVQRSESEVLLEWLCGLANEDGVME
ncbi:MAG TPA: hypothetical protein VN578_25745 [Candidatus Binatia bacterium]|jgi:hypothetical protein|nr:hypothetical protein [Candidatus Binatia bacterium]